MSESATRPDQAGTTPGAIAWLDVTAERLEAAAVYRPRTGPLGLQIAPLRIGHTTYAFRGARLRGTRCVWSAATVCGAELFRPARVSVPPPFEGSVQLLVRLDSRGSVFDRDLVPECGALRVADPAEEVSEQFLVNAHLFTLSVPVAALGMEAAVVSEMREHEYDLTPFQWHVLHSAVGLLVGGGDELCSTSSLVGIDRYLAALAALLLRTAVRRTTPDLAHIEQVRLRTDAIIYEQAADPGLTPATIAAQLNISLRQLYRAFAGTESPAARIRRRRLERAAEILAARSGPGHVERVALECGFASAEYFSRAFRREFGLSPRAYRSAHKDAIHR